MKNTRPRGIRNFKEQSFQDKLCFTFEVKHLEKSGFTRLRRTAASISCLVSWPEAKYLFQGFTGLFKLSREEI